MEDAPQTTAIVTFSRSGHSRRIAERLACALHGTIIELNAPAYDGPLGYLRAAINSLRQTCTLAPQTFTSLADYSRVVLCGPVWTSYPAIPLRGLLTSGIPLPPSVSLFLTRGGRPPAVKAFATAEADLGRPLTAVASLGNVDEGSPNEDRIVEAFLKELEAAQAEDHSDPSYIRLHAL